MKFQKRDSHDINSIIRSVQHSSLTPESNKVPKSWLTKFMTGVGHSKKVHVHSFHGVCLMLISETGCYITGSLYYEIDNLPNFISRHIDFEELAKFKESNMSDFKAFGAVFQNGKMIKNA